MQILLTNDDGVSSPSLWALREELATIGTVTVVAPKSQQSGVGHAITYRRPVLVDEVSRDGGRAYALSGTPADCVKFALLELMSQRPDLVVSGINPGLNLGCNVFYSGTVAAAMEGALNGVLSVAFSSTPDATHSPREVAEEATRALSFILARSASLPSLAYNVNLPAPAKEPPEIVFAPHRPDVFQEQYVRAELDGQPGFRLDLPYGEQTGPGDGCDVLAVQRGKISVTPLRPSLTDDQCLQELNGQATDS